MRRQPMKNHAQDPNNMPKKRIDDTCLPQEKSLYSREEKCPILYTLDIIGGKWKLPIIWALAKQKEIRYNALRRSVVGISNMMLTKCLRELEENGIVQRMQYPEIPPRVEYSLTARGQELLPSLNNLYEWGKKQIEFTGLQQAE
ncbi:MAG: winged helix-turn-helix transcriptional regulator [Desulfovibrio sp.]|uniref:winged helix-turn-helix transcriptional regulator n=1 Tax=Desulfovibrio sp. 7SRBS1 TaxID=3378064 RepID=UPI003B3F91D6